jgi:hypothetical protein
MAEHITSLRIGPGKRSPFNWLKWLDEEVRRDASGSNWQQHPPFQFARCRLFMMARYPQLQRPFHDQVLTQEWSRGENQILGHPEARQGLDGLNDRQRKELAALFLDSIDSLKAYRSYRRTATRVHKLAGETARQTRMLGRKLGKARRALEDLHEYAGSLDELLSRDHMRATKTCLETLRMLKEDTDPDFYRSIKGEYPALEDPVTLGMVQLYWFFRHGCGFSGDQAEVQVAQIRNALWAEHGVPQVDYRPNYQMAGVSRGCDAVHIAVLRFMKGTSRRRTL